jgi:hypothetical protein
MRHSEMKGAGEWMITVVSFEVGIFTVNARIVKYRQLFFGRLG